MARPPSHKAAEEGGCGVVGLAASEPVAGRHLVAPARQMHNRGNGKGGGLAAAGLVPEQMGVPAETLREATLLQIAYLDPKARPEVEQDAILPYYDVLEGYAIPTVDDYRQVAGLEVRPPDVVRYFVRARPGALARFAAEQDLEEMEARRVEDEFVYRNSFRLNQRYYASLGEQRAFVLSHGRDLLVLKIVGYAEQAAAYYQLEDLKAHVWVAHQRYPTKGRVWHPGGAHPFIGLNEALVHNGDFANYYGVVTYLRQRNIVPLFLTDTEVSALLFDLLDRVYGYPLEVTIEALAPTTERDFQLLPADKRRLYQAVQSTHLHASPDGPWFFIIARSHPDERQWQLLGITDTSMLRPQVFALHDGKVQVGLIASEKQAIDAALESLAAEDERICPVADRTWNARGGSHTDGGAFVFTVRETRPVGEPGHRGTGIGQPEWKWARERVGDHGQVWGTADGARGSGAQQSEHGQGDGRRHVVAHGGISSNGAFSPSMDRRRAGGRGSGVAAAVPGGARLGLWGADLVLPAFGSPGRGRVAPGGGRLAPGRGRIAPNRGRLAPGQRPI